MTREGWEVINVKSELITKLLTEVEGAEDSSKAGLCNRAIRQYLNSLKKGITVDQAINSIFEWEKEDAEKVFFAAAKRIFETNGAVYEWAINFICQQSGIDFERLNKLMNQSTSPTPEEILALTKAMKIEHSTAKKVLNLKNGEKLTERQKNSNA